MICRTHTVKETVLHMAYIVFLSVFGVLAAYSAVFAFFNISCRDDALTACMTGGYALLILAVDYFECRAMGAWLYMDDDGLGIKRFGKTKVYLRWDEIQDIGTGKLLTVFGNKDRIYFCNRKLNEEERSDLVVLKSQTVLFSYIPKTWYDKMCERLPVPMPEGIKEKYVK